MMRVPVSACRLSQALRCANASAKPSVSRVEENAALDVRKLARLWRLSGSGDPCAVHINEVENPTYNPRSGVPMENSPVVMETRFELKPRNAWTDELGARFNWLAAARMFAIR